jgi:hypothetical protein
MKDIWNTMKRPSLRIMTVEEEEIQTKGIDNLFKRLTAENFANLEKKRATHVLTEHQIVRTKKEPPKDTL